MGTPGPGCTLPPARYKPGIVVRLPGRRKDAQGLFVAAPYSAPSDPGNRRAKSLGVVTWLSSTPSSRPAWASLFRMCVSHRETSSTSKPLGRAGALTKMNRRSAPSGATSPS